MFEIIAFEPILALEMLGAVFTAFFMACEGAKSDCLFSGSLVKD